MSRRDASSSTARWIAIIFLLGMTMILFMLWTTTRRAAEDAIPDAVPLAEIPQDVSIRDVDGVWTFVVRDGDDVWTVLPDTGFEGLRAAWCPSRGVFTTLDEGGLYDRHGRRLAGPSPDDLAGLLVRRDGPVVRIDATTIVAARPGAAEPPPDFTEIYACEEVLQAPGGSRP